MLILALDTTSRQGSFALARDGEIMTSRTVAAAEGFGDAVYQNIAALLADAGLELSAVDAFAAASGPGSFTGVRIGLTAAKALAEAMGKKVVPVSNLDALAAAVPGDLRAAVVDGRRGEVFAALYDAALKSLRAPAALAWSRFLESLGGQEPHWVSNQAATFAAGGPAPLPPAARRTVVDAVAEPLALLAWERLLTGGGLAPEEVDAAYIRRPDAERNWKSP